MRTIVGLVIAVTLFVVLLGPAQGAMAGVPGGPDTVPQAVAEGYPELSGPGVVTFDSYNDPPIRNSVRTLVQGTRQSDGSCQFSYETPLVEPGDPVPASRPLACEEATCRCLVETGEAVSPPPSGTEQRPVPVPAARPERSGTGLLSVPGWSYSYEYQVYWHDPVEITVSRAKPYILWNSDGTRITDCAGNTTTEWNSGTGWQEISKSIDVYYAGENYAECYSQADVVHHNSQFPCPFGSTGIGYQPVGIKAHYASSGAVGFQTTWSWGGCPWMLHWHTYGPYPF